MQENPLALIRKITNYLYTFPVVDNYNSWYKHAANFLVAYQILITGIFFYENKVFLLELWNNWDRIP